MDSVSTNTSLYIPAADGKTFIANPADNSKGSTNMISTNPKDDGKMAGWYYASSSSSWENYTNAKNDGLATGKTYRALSKDVEIENTINAAELPSSVQNYLTKNNIDPTAGKGGSINTGAKDLKDSSGTAAITVPEGVTRQGLTESDGSYQSSPLIFFVDDSGLLRCFYSANGDNHGCSYVYEKPDDTRIKTESLQYAVGSFVSALKSSSPSSKVAAVRFSTDGVATTTEGDGNNHVKSDDAAKLVLLDWTDDPLKSSEMLSMNRKKDGVSGGDGYEVSTPSVDKGKGPVTGVNQYNYGLTGGTHTWVGLDAYMSQLHDRLAQVNTATDRKKYLIIFTDGNDDDYRKSDTRAIELAQELRSEKFGYTIYAVMLTGGTVSGDSGFLEKLVGPPESTGTKAAAAFDAKDYVFASSDAETLRTFFTENILSDIADNLFDYTVQDYIDPRFDLVDADGKTISLLGDGKVQREGESTVTLPAEKAVLHPEAGAAAAAPYTVKVKGSKGAGTAQLYYDSAKGMYYLKWVGQTIPGCDVDAKSLSVWNATVTVKAKEDLIGGSAILTNGNEADMNMVCHEDDEGKSSGTKDSVQSTDDEYPSKGFPRTAVNVKSLDLSVTGGEQTIYMGEAISPKELAKTVSGSLKLKTDGADEGGYLAQYAAKNNTTVEALVQQMLDSEDGTLSIPYTYLKNDKNTVLTPHEKDKLGTLTFKWEQTAPDAKDTPDETAGKCESIT